MKPILFNTDMVRAILDGRKSVTRRVMKPQPIWTGCGMRWWWKGNKFWWRDSWNPMETITEKHSIFKPGDILYVRETWRVQSAHRFEADARIEYKAGGPMTTIQFPGRKSQSCSRTKFDAFVWKWNNDKWHPSIHMPKEAARLFLRVTNVRVERLQDMQPYDIAFEGFRRQRDFIALWDSSIKKADLPLYGWAANPWVWVIEFERISREDAIRA